MKTIFKAVFVLPAAAVLQIDFVFPGTPPTHAAADRTNDALAGKVACGGMVNAYSSLRAASR
jgi:hypothetical protein